MKKRRVQIYLDEERYRKIADESQRRGTSIGAVVRDAIDRLPTDREQRRALLAAILAAGPMPVPDDPTDLRRELDNSRGRSEGMR